MKKTLLTILLAAICILTVSAQRRSTHEEYISKYRDLAYGEMEIYGIPASITMAQGLLESDCGNSRLAVEARNHFGIKCKRDWTGPTITHDDDEKGECFRKYTSAEESYRDHSEFLDKSPRYQKLFKLDPTDYKAWAHGLKECGYATNPRYGHLLIKLIEDHQLYLLDTGTDYASAEKPPKVEEKIKAEEGAIIAPSQKVDVDNYVVALYTMGGYPVYANNGSEFVLVREGDTYGRIAVLAGVSEKRLRKFNDVSPAAQPKSGEQVYLSAKANRADNGKLIHVAQQGESMHSVSQKYGIKLKKLTRINRIPVDARLSAGQQVRLM